MTCQVCGRVGEPDTFTVRGDRRVCRDVAVCTDGVFNPPVWQLALLTPDGVEVHRRRAHTEKDGTTLRVIPDDDQEVTITAPVVSQIAVYNAGVEFARVQLPALASAGCTISTMAVTMRGLQ